jgi:hypothetical protein
MTGTPAACGDIAIVAAMFGPKFCHATTGSVSE